MSIKNGYEAKKTRKMYKKYVEELAKNDFFVYVDRIISRWKLVAAVSILINILFIVYFVVRYYGTKF